MSPDFKVQRDTNRFFCLGMDLNRPVDELKQLKYALLKNVRAYQTGRLEARKGLTKIGEVSGAVHSIRRLNVPRTSNWTRVIGSGANLSLGQSSFTQIDTGYSGNPLALVPYRPSQSPDPWMYVMDSARQRKVNVDGSLHFVGLPPPTLPPVAGRDSTSGSVPFKEVFPAQMYSSGWASGPAFVGDVSGGKFLVASLNTILYDSGTTGWCTIQPGVMTGIVRNMLLSLSGFAPGEEEEVVVTAVSNGFPDSTTIAAIATLPSGQSSIVLTGITSGIEASGILENVTKGESTLITAVISGPDAEQAILCTPPSPWVVGDTVYVRSAFRCYTTTTHTEMEAIQNHSLRMHTNITEDLALPLTGYATSPKFNPALDLSKITADISATPDSYIAINLSLTHPQDTTLIKIMFGCTNTADQDKKFDTDYFYVTLTPDQLDETNGMRIKIAEFLQVGNPSWKNIYYFQIETTIRDPINYDEREEWDNIHTYTYFHSIYLSGTSGPDSGTIGSGYRYRYRARASSTGVVSNWSPATLEELLLNGEAVSVVAPEQYTAAAEVDKLDFQRRGGSIPDDWYYIGSVDNTVTPTPFIDKYPDDVVIANPSEGQDHYQLWPIIGAPVSGTGATVTGVSVSGTSFSTDWAPDTPILINGVWYTIYQVYSSTSLQIYESGGVQTNVGWEIPEPILQGQPMPCFWGPLNDTFFGCGDPVNPQRLYWTNVGDADTTRQTNWLDITTPSEPLMNGVIYNGRCYVWSSERFFQILPETQDESGAVTGWNYVEIPSGKGLWARWAFTNPQSIPGDVLFFLSKDGIYGTDGGSPSDITAEDLRPLFPNEGNLGEDVNTVPAPYMVAPAAARFRLAFYDDYLYFDYPSSDYVVSTTTEFSDSLNLWGDSITSADYQAFSIDYLSLTWGDSLQLTLTTAGHDFSDDANFLSDQLAAGVA